MDISIFAKIEEEEKKNKSFLSKIKTEKFHLKVSSVYVELSKLYSCL